jgi:hypothetical protein
MLVIIISIPRSKWLCYEKDFKGTDIPAPTDHREIGDKLHAFSATAIRGRESSALYSVHTYPVERTSNGKGKVVAVLNQLSITP